MEVFRPNKISAPAITAFRGESITCTEEKESFLQNKQVAGKSSDSSSESDEETESDDIDYEDDDKERYEMRANSIIEIIQKDNITRHCFTLTTRISRVILSLLGNLTLCCNQENC